VELFETTISLSKWRVPPEYLTILPNIRVLILGSYSSPFLSRLESIRDEIIDRGISNAKLVKDFKVPAQQPNERLQAYNLRKSEYWIDRADIMIFVFFDGTDNASVGIELRTTLNNPGNAWRTLLAHTETTRSLVVGLGIRYQPDLSLIPFSNDEDIVEQAEGNVIRLLERFYSLIYQRQSGEWEFFSI